MGFGAKCKKSVGSVSSHNFLISKSALPALAFIPEEDKKEYLEAKRLIPKIVEIESDPARFLRTENGNPWNAAYRLIMYWKYRKEVFGNERWLLPMNMSGHGAMSPGDVELMKKDVIVTQKWPDKAVVTYIDLSPAPEQDSMFISRALYYMVTVTGDAETETSGVYVIKAISPELFLRRRTKGRNWEIIRKALPVRVRQVFLLGRRTSHMTDTLIRFSVGMMKIVSEFFLGSPPEYISDLNVQEALETMTSYGIPHQCIPCFLGGGWDMRGIPIDPGTDLAPSPLPSASGSTDALCPVSSNNESDAKPKRKRGRPPKDTSIVCTDDLREECDGYEEFTKKRNALYSRRLYRKKRQEQDELQRKVQMLSDENLRLKREGGRLEGLIADAKLQIAFADDDIIGKSSAVNPEFASSTAQVVQPFQGNLL